MVARGFLKYPVKKIAQLRMEHIFPLHPSPLFFYWSSVVLLPVTFRLHHPQLSSLPHRHSSNFYLLLLNSPINLGQFLIISPIDVAQPHPSIHKLLVRLLLSFL